MEGQAKAGWCGVVQAPQQVALADWLPSHTASPCHPCSQPHLCKHIVIMAAHRHSSTHNTRSRCLDGLLIRPQNLAGRSGSSSGPAAQRRRRVAACKAWRATR